MVREAEGSSIRTSRSLPLRLVSQHQSASRGAMRGHQYGTLTRQHRSSCRRKGGEAARNKAARVAPESSSDRPRLPGTAPSAKSRIRDVGAELQHPCRQYQRFYQSIVLEKPRKSNYAIQISQSNGEDQTKYKLRLLGFCRQDGAQGSGRPAGVPLKPPLRGQPARRELQERSGNGARDPPQD